MIVIFRVDSVSEGGQVFALFPEDPASIDGKLCTVYERVGQHGAADYDLCITRSRQASVNEFAPLLEELRKIGYGDLVVRERATREMHLKRGAIAKANNH